MDDESEHCLRLVQVWLRFSNMLAGGLIGKCSYLDNILVCDSEDLATEVAKQTFAVKRAEDARLAASQGKGSGIVQGIIDAANVRF